MALQWGIVDVRSWLASMPIGTLDFWEAFDAVEPIGGQWEQSAMIAHQIAIKTFCDAGQKPPEWEQFMPPRYQPPKETKIDIPTETDAVNQFRSLAAAFGLSEVIDGNND